MADLELVQSALRSGVELCTDRLQALADEPAMIRQLGAISAGKPLASEQSGAPGDTTETWSELLGAKGYSTIELTTLLMAGFQQAAASRD